MTKFKGYKVLYNEVLDINYENIEGEFYVDSKEELKQKAHEFLKENREEDFEDEEIEEIELDLRWRGSGLYCFWGLGFVSEYTLAHIEEIFEAETQVNPSIFLGDKITIEMEKLEFLNGYNHVFLWCG